MPFYPEKEKIQEHFVVNLDIEGGQKKLTANLTKDDLYLEMNKIMLDFWGVDNSTDNAIMHMFVTENKNVELDEKLKRMESWGETIKAYNKIMTQESGKIYERQDLLTMLKTGKIPRPINIIFRGGSPGLKKLYEHLALETNPQNSREFIIQWEKLQELAESGEFVNAWKKIKGI